ncbi:hypothetical protein F4861DRAFT_517466 [Xylaria intraflava]|nr:hypothetical protein F4861DRAFT_517466 [Xylaria intraflava]
MAANIPQMGGGGPVRRPQNQQQLAQLIFSQIVTQQIPPGWHASVPVNVRVFNVTNIINNSFSAVPPSENNQIVHAGLAYEREAFTTSPDKATYEARIMARVNELFKKRQANEAMQNNSTAQAAAQAQNQAQMMMGQNMQMRGMGQPLQQGFQHLPQQMQSPPLNQQGQPGIGVNNPNGLPMNTNQQVMQMGAQMRPQIGLQGGMASLSPQDRLKVNQLAVARLNSLNEPQRSNLRSMVHQRFGPQILAQLQQEGVDPMLYYFQSQILQNMAKSQAGVTQPGMAMQHHQQRSMNQPVQQLQTGPNGEFGPFTNVESIINQQKAGRIAEEAGQIVVPASNGAGRNATPQPMGLLPGPNQGVGQATLPHQLSQQFNHQPAQQLKMDQRAAQTQAQIRAQAQAKQMQGQPGGLNGPGGTSQSPAMNTLNAPVRRTPMGVGQTEAHPQMGQGNMPFGQQIMDPRFNHPGQRTPAAANSGMNRNMFLQKIYAQMPMDTRQHIMSLPQDKIPEMLLRWNATHMNGQVAGRQPQLGQPGPGNPVPQSVAQFTPGNNSGGQQPNLGMGMNQQSQMMMQQQMNKLRNPNAPQAPMDRGALMDNMNVPPGFFAQLRSTQHVDPPPEVKKWGQLKQWMAQKSIHQPSMTTLLEVQNAQFQTFLKNSPSFAAASSQLPQSHLPQQGIPPNQVISRMGQPTPNIAGSNPNIIISPQDLQNAKSRERFKGLSDERIHQVLVQMKMRAFEQRAAGRMPGQQIQTSQPSQPSQTTATAPSQPVDEAAASQRQQNTSHETATTSPVTQVRNAKQPQNNRPAQNVPVATTSKNGTKRPISDDVTEVPNPSSTPTQRPHPQQHQSGPHPVQTQIPQVGPEKIAAANPEQRQKYEAMLKNRQSAPNQMSEEMLRLQAIGREEYQTSSKEQLPDILMTPEQYRDTAQRLQAMNGEMDKIRKVLGRWYALTHDDARARLFFKLRMRLVKQYADGEKMSQLRDKFSITPADLDNTRSLFESIAKDVASYFPQNMRKNPSQQNGAEPAPQGVPARPSAPSAPSVPSAVSAPNTQSTPLSAVNLEKQTQALSKMNQRSNSRTGQPPAAPTTAQPPFSFGAQSPDGQPTYAGKPTVTQDNLHLPARKKARIGTGPTLNGSSSNASPQVPIRSSPDVNKRQVAAETRQAPETLQFLCTDPFCEAHTIGFSTEEARRKHMEEAHIKPAEDPLKFAADGLVEIIGSDMNGKVKKSPTTGDNTQSPGDTSKQLQTPINRSDASQGTAMKRHGSAMGSKASKLAKTATDKAGTPKPDSGLGTVDGLTPVTVTNAVTAPQAVGGEPMGTTIDPQELLSSVTGLEMGGNGTILDMALYRAITPKDTPESSNGSSSEPNSDVSEGVTLNVTLDMGFDSWNPFASGFEMVNPDLGGTDNMLSVAYPDFTWDDVNPDFDQPFTLDTSVFSLDTS